MTALPQPLPPGSIVGILGGGQLGRMTALAAAQLGYRSHIFCPNPGEPALQVTPLATVADYGDREALARFAASVDVITFEFENVPSDSAAFLAEQRLVRPDPEILRICRNRLSEKDFLASIGVETTRYAEVTGIEGLRRELRNLGIPSVLKTAELGYDGKGQALLRSADDAAAAWDAVRGHNSESVAVLEAFVDFRMEMSVVVARGVREQTACYVPVENQHRSHILDSTIAPARISDVAASRAEAIARHIAESLDLIGIVGVEMFLTAEDRVLVNELAPRPHNSGHWTMDACLTSQFEQFVRAVVGLPLGSPERHSDAVMTNLLGADANDWEALLGDPMVKLHLYGKQDARPGRKMGHVTRLGPRSSQRS